MVIKTLKKFDRNPKNFKSSRVHTGFTIVELLVVLSVIALLLSIVTPRYLSKVEEGQEVVLKQNLSSLRHSLDQYYADQGVYPDTLNQLVEKRYLRDIPIDPMSRTTEWRIIIDKQSGVGIYDVKSTSDVMGSDKRSYSEW